MIEPIRMSDKIGITDWIDEHFRGSSEDLFIHVTYSVTDPPIENVFVLTSKGGYDKPWSIAVIKAPHLKNTPEWNLDVLQRDFPQFVEWYLFNPECL